MALIRNRLGSIVQKYNSFKKIQFQFTQIRYGSYVSSPSIHDVGKVNTKYETTNVTEEWKYVERLLPQLIIPDPVPKSEYPSGWIPQGENLDNKPYFVRRTKNHMLPVYMKIKDWGVRRWTYVRKIEGDIWLLEEELRNFLQKDSIKPIRSQVHEFAGYILFHGDHVNAIKHYLLERQF